MPLSINVGLSRKTSKDYQSTGYSINVTAELDQTLLAKPDELQRQIDGLYQQAHDAIDRQAASAPEPSRANGDNGNGHDRRTYRSNRFARNGNGNGNGNGSRNGGGGNGEMTASQRRAILAIASRLNIDADQEATDIVGASLDALTLRQASDLIDHLRSLQPANGK